MVRIDSGKAAAEKAEDAARPLLVEVGIRGAVQGVVQLFPYLA